MRESTEAFDVDNAAEEFCVEGVEAFLLTFGECPYI